MWDRQCWLRYAPRRLACAHCGRNSVERAAWHAAGVGYTVRDSQHIHVHTPSVFRHGQKTLAQRGFPFVKAVCPDDITTHKGHEPLRQVNLAPELVLMLDLLADHNNEPPEIW
jgi:hypothetical protein